MRFSKPLSRIHVVLCSALVTPPLAMAASQTLEYEYDALGRVELVKDNVNGNRNYQYDPAGNRKNVTTGAASTPPAPVCYASIPWYYGSTLTMECSEATRPWDSVKTSACAAQCPQ